jgi:hypothetical protein
MWKRICKHIPSSATQSPVYIKLVSTTVSARVQSCLQHQNQLVKATSDPMSGKEGIVETYPSSSPRRASSRPQRWYHLFGKDVAWVSVDAGYETDSETSSLDEAIVRPDHNVFEAAEATDIYKLVDGFEGTHRFDSKATWEASDEKKLVRRVFSDINTLPVT